MTNATGLALAIGLALLVALVLLWGGGARADALQVGDPAPAFALPDAHGETHRLEDYRGSWLLLYFYPKDDTPGCTKEACHFRDGFLELRRMGAWVVGVSLDDSTSHQAFASKYELPFPLLSDRGGKVARAYGSLTDLGLLKLAKRHSFLIDPAGRIARIYRDVDPDTHNQEVVADIQALQAGARDSGRGAGDTGAD